jgi:hypothetical protein
MAFSKRFPRSSSLRIHGGSKVEKLPGIADTLNVKAPAIALTFPPKRFILGQMKPSFTNEIKGFFAPASYGRSLLLSAIARDLKRTHSTIRALSVLYSKEYHRASTGSAKFDLFTHHALTEGTHEGRC